MLGAWGIMTGMVATCRLSEPWQVPRGKKEVQSDLPELSQAKYDSTKVRGVNLAVIQSYRRCSGAENPRSRGCEWKGIVRGHKNRASLSCSTSARWWC